MSVSLLQTSGDNHISNLLKLKTPPAPLQGVEARGKGNRSRVEIHQWFFSNPLSKLIIEARRCLCVTVAGVEHGGRVPTAYIYIYKFSRRKIFPSPRKLYRAREGGERAQIGGVYNTDVKSVFDQGDR